jgi:hypothetical protein
MFKLYNVRLSEVIVFEEPSVNKIDTPIDANDDTPTPAWLASEDCGVRRVWDDVTDTDDAPGKVVYRNPRPDPITLPQLSDKVADKYADDDRLAALTGTNAL